MLIRKKSYPRAALIGNPSDGYYGKTIAFVFRNFYAETTVYESPNLEILPSVLDYNVYKSVAHLSESIQQFGYYGGIRLLKACIKKFYEYTQTCGYQLDQKNFTIQYQSNIPNRLGMAGSSAIITASMKAISAFYGIKIRPEILANLVLSVEKQELGIEAGLQDRVAQAYQKPVYMDFNRDHMEKYGYGKYTTIEIPQNLPLYIAYRTDLAEGSEILHSRLREDYNEGKTVVLNAIKEWSSLTDKVLECLQTHEYGELGKCLDRNFDLRCEVCGSSVSEKNRHMVQIARKFGASAKLTGSGGCIVGLYDPEKLTQMQAALRGYHVELIHPEIVTEGPGL